MATYFRIQSAKRDVTDLLDTTSQVSRGWGNEADQDGVSVCESLEALAAYLTSDAGQGIPFGAGHWVIVEVAGTYLGRGADEGELLVSPTAIVSVRDLDDDFYALLDAAYDVAA